MFGWLRRFFYSDDEVVKLAAGLAEPEAEMMRELLESNGVAAMAKNMSPLAAYLGVYPLPAPAPNSYAIYVKQSDVDRATEVLRPAMSPGKLSRQAAESRREARRDRRRRSP
jgi:hypothetical protein